MTLAPPLPLALAPLLIVSCDLMWQDFEQTIRRLEFDLSEHMKVLNRADAMNKYLLKEVNELRKERGMREVELNSLSVQVDGLRDKQQDQTRADLSHVIHLIDSGVKEGVLKVGVSCGCGHGYDAHLHDAVIGIETAESECSLSP